MKKYTNPLSLWMLLLCGIVFSCVQEDSSSLELQGTIRFGGISLEFEPMGSSQGRTTGNSPWIHVFPNSADLVFTNKATGQQYVLKYNPNNFSIPYTITLPYGDYEYHSTVEGGTFSAFLPFEARGEFFLDKQSMEITLQAETDYGLVTVKNQYVEKASVTDGEKESGFVLHQDSYYWFLYVQGGTAATLKIMESFKGTTISRELNIQAYMHYNFVLKLLEGAAAITDLTLAPFDLEKEEILIGSGSEFFEENGTIKCPEATPGERGRVNDKIYEAVDRALLVQRRDEGADLSCVCTSLVADMSEMFVRASSFNQPIGNWDVSNVTTMYKMFYETKNFNQPIGNWDVSSVTNMSGMFAGTISYQNGFNQPIGNWDVSNVTDMHNMFFLAYSFNQPIGDWDVSNVTNMSGMFRFASRFNQPIENWDVSNVTNMSGLFSGEMESQSDFNQPIGNWDVSKVTNMGGMFRWNRNFNQPIGNWDVSSVTNMSAMFAWTHFNQPIENWDVSNVTRMQFMFQSANTFNQPIGKWDVSNVTSMIWMFEDADSFNYPIGNWDVSNVTNMQSMFFSANSFNHPIGDWDVSNVTDMNSMFSSAENFNQDLSSWCVQNILSEPTSFSIASALSDTNKPVWGTCPG